MKYPELRGRIMSAKMGPIAKGKLKKQRGKKTTKSNARSGYKK